MRRRRPTRSCRSACRAPGRNVWCWISKGETRNAMNKYGGNAEAIAALVREAEVHRDVYVDPEVFELEMEHLFPNSWIYVGHASQLAKPGDFITATIG